MENITIKLAEAHKIQMKNFDVKKEIKSIQEYINSFELELNENTVSLMCLRGYYDNFSKRTNTVFLFINTLGKCIKEIHGVIKMAVDIKAVNFAKATIDFDEEFMGSLEHNEALLVHMDVPTRGMNEDKVFTSNELEVKFTDIRVTYVN